MYVTLLIEVVALWPIMCSQLYVLIFVGTESPTWRYKLPEYTDVQDLAYKVLTFSDKNYKT